MPGCHSSLYLPVSDQACGGGNRRMKLEELIAQYEIGFECRPVALSEQLFRCRVTRGGRGVSMVYQGEQPTLAAVLTRLAGAARSQEPTKQPNPHLGKRGARRDEASFKTWCTKYSFDPDSREVARTVPHCAAQIGGTEARPSRRVFRKLLWEVEP